MTLPDFEHVEPENLAQAFRFLKEYSGRAKPIAGGTDLLNAMRHRLVEPACLVDLKRIPDLRHLEVDEARGLVLGAALTLSEIIQSPLVQEKAPLLAQAAATVGAPPLQNMGTLGGNVCLNTRCFYYNQSKSWRSSRPACLKAGGSVCHVVKKSKKCFSAFQADAACALFALKAEVRLVKEEGERTIPLSEFYSGDGKNPNRLEPNEILKEIIVPSNSGLGGRYAKLSPREAIDFPHLGVAVCMSLDEEKKIRDLRIVLNAVDSVPLQVEKAEELLNGQRPDVKLFEEAGRLAFEMAHPVNNTGGSSHYRKKMVRVLTRRVLTDISDIASKEMK
jgi:4-hydroxybenzoyl-CoA reductase subunit beta